MHPAHRTTLLGAYPALRELTPPALARLEALAGPVRTAPGQVLFDGDRPVEALPLLLEGAIRVTRRGPDGREVLLYRLRPGEGCLVTIGALLGETPPAAAGTAESEGLVLALPRELFTSLLLEAPGFRRFVFASLTRRMAQVLTLVDDLVFRRVDERLAARLLLQPQPLSATHQQLADDLGTSREVVSRILGGFQAAGLIRLGRRRIDLLDLEALRRLQGEHGESSSRWNPAEPSPPPGRPRATPHPDRR